MGETDYKDPEWTDEDFKEMREATEQSRRRHPDHPTTVRGVAYEIVTRKQEKLSAFAKEWLDLARREPNHPTVLAVREAMPAQIIGPGSFEYLDQVAEVIMQLRLSQPSTPTLTPESDRPYSKLSEEQKGHGGPGGCRELADQQKYPAVPWHEIHRVTSVSIRKEQLTDMSEYERLSPHEQTLLLRRTMRVYAAHRHPQREVEVAKIIEQIKKELKAGRRVH